MSRTTTSHRVFHGSSGTNFDRLFNSELGQRLLARSEQRADAMLARSDAAQTDAPAVERLKRKTAELSRRQFFTDATPIVSKFDAMESASFASSAAPGDTGLRRAALRLRKIWEHDKTGVLTIAAIERLRADVGRETSKTAAFVLFDRMLNNGVGLGSLRRLARQIHSQSDYDRLVAEYGLAGDDRQSRTARQILLYQVNKRAGLQDGTCDFCGEPSDNLTPEPVPQNEDAVVCDKCKASEQEFDSEAKAPPGMEKTVEKMKKHPEIDNPFALAWSMFNKKKESMGRRRAGDAGDAGEQAWHPDVNEEAGEDAVDVKARRADSLGAPEINEQQPDAHGVAVDDAELRAKGRRRAVIAAELRRRFGGRPAAFSPVQARGLKADLFDWWTAKQAQDESADEELAEDIEEVVNRHMRENAPEELREGHEPWAGKASVKLVKSVRAEARKRGMTFEEAEQIAAELNRRVNGSRVALSLAQVNRIKSELFGFMEEVRREAQGIVGPSDTAAADGEPAVEAEWREFYDIREDEPEDEMDRDAQDNAETCQACGFQHEPCDPDGTDQPGWCECEHAGISTDCRCCACRAHNNWQRFMQASTRGGSGLLVSRARVEDALLAGKRIATRGYQLAIVNRGGRDQVELTGAEIPPMAWPLRKMTAAIDYFAKVVEGQADDPDAGLVMCSSCGRMSKFKRTTGEDGTEYMECQSCGGLDTLQEEGRRAQADDPFVDEVARELLDGLAGQQPTDWKEAVWRVIDSEAPKYDNVDVDAVVARVQEMGREGRRGQFDPSVSAQQDDAVKPPKAKQPLGPESSQEDVESLEPSSIPDSHPAQDQSGTSEPDDNMGEGVTEDDVSSLEAGGKIKQQHPADDQSGVNLPDTDPGRHSSDDEPAVFDPSIESSSKKAQIRQALRGHLTYSTAE